MDIAIGAPRPWRTQTFRQCMKSLAWTVGLTGVFVVWYAVEKWSLHLGKHERLVRSPALVPMTILGLPHFLIGFLFLATSRRMRGARAYATLAGLLVVSVGLCFAFAAAGGYRVDHRLPTAAVALYFIVHELRDGAFFFRAYGDGPQGVETARTARFLALTTALFVLVLAAGGAVLFDAYNRHRGRLGALDPILPLGLGTGWRALVVLAALVGAGFLLVRRWAKGERDSWRAWLARSRPMLAIYGLFLAVVALGAVFGTVLEAIVLWHVVEWFFFSLHQIGRAEGKGPPPVGWVEKAKRTRTGFLALHLGLAAVVFALMLVWTYGFGKRGPLTAVVGPEAFYYWTIVHVTVSFFPRSG